MGIRKIIGNLLNTKLPLHNLIYRVCARMRGVYGVVFMLHRVEETNDSNFRYNENMKVSPLYLEQIILDYKKKGFDFYSLDDIYDLYINGKKITRPFVCFTLDDGYLDNYLKAYPIFKKYNVPFAIYISTDFPNEKAFLWWYALEDLLQTKSSLVLSTGEVYDLSTKNNKEEAFISIREKILCLPKENFLDAFKRLLVWEDLDYLKYVKGLSMNWKQIIELSKEPLCTIGGHTITHPSFKALSDNQIVTEVNNGCCELESYIGKPVLHFAYPFGSIMEVGEREMLITERIPFRTIASTRQHLMYSSTNRLRIPRIMLQNPDIN